MLLSQIKNYKVILATVIIYCVFATVMVSYFTPPANLEIPKDSLLDLAIGFASRLGFLVMFIVFTLILRIMFVDRPRRLIKQIYNDFRTIWISPQFLLRGLLMITCLYFFISSFTAMKQLIPHIHPYGNFDELFYQIDKTIHFGFSPWEITHSIFSAPIFTFIINIAYNLWFFILYAIFTLQAFIHENERTRKTYFLSFFLCWIINGTLFATILSSVGPCYYDLIYALENGPYAPLMERLGAINEIYPIWALETQDRLWGLYSDRNTILGGGISAMPSLHVSIALIQVFLGYRINKFCGRLLLAFFFIILIGSVHLGWHYAIDGYFSILTTTGIWFFSRWIANRTTPDIVLPYSLGQSQAAPRTPEESP